jgi:predicted Rossmann fold flavoprotein
VRAVAPWVADLRGITLRDVRVQVIEGESVLDQRRGSLLFAHFGLTGPVILDISRTISGHWRPASLQLEIDLLPQMKETEFDEFLRKQSQESGKKQLAVVLATLLPRRLCDHMLSLCGLPADRKVAALSREERALITANIKHLRLPVVGTLGFEKAEVTAGGIALSEIDSRNMQSKLVPNLFLAGEVLDLDGPIGGYNFQAAWSTGWLAGSSV